MVLVKKTMSKEVMTAHDSIVIERQLEEIKEIIDNGNNFFNRKDAKQSLLEMVSSIENNLDWIKDYAGLNEME